MLYIKARKDTGYIEGFTFDKGSKGQVRLYINVTGYPFNFDPLLPVMDRVWVAKSISPTKVIITMYVADFESMPPDFKARTKVMRSNYKFYTDYSWADIHNPTKNYWDSFWEAVRKTQELIRFKHNPSEYQSSLAMAKWYIAHYRILITENYTPKYGKPMESVKRSKIIPAPSHAFDFEHLYGKI